MPIYEYMCTTCGERFEIKQKMSDPPITTCAQFSCAKSEPVEKVISPPAIMFKGTGWYVTDYSDKLKEPQKAGADGKPAEKTSETKAEGGSDSGTSKKTEGTNTGSAASTESGTTSGSSGTTTSSSSSSEKTG